MKLKNVLKAIWMEKSNQNNFEILTKIKKYIFIILCQIIQML